MLIRLIAKNIYSFNEQVEFALIPDKEQHLSWHKRSCNNITGLRLGAIYGANGAGKTNVIKVLSFLQGIIKNGKINQPQELIRFKLDARCKEEPTTVAIEFFDNAKVYYYSITYNTEGILYEGLSESKPDEDLCIFERQFEGKESIVFGKDYIMSDKNRMFIELLEEKLIKRNNLLITYLAINNGDDFKDISAAYNWLTKNLRVVMSSRTNPNISDLLDGNSELLDFTNALIKNSETGVLGIRLEVETLKPGENISKEEYDFMSHSLNQQSEYPLHRGGIDLGTSIVKENGELKRKKLSTTHITMDGEKEDFYIGDESEGTRRLLHYVPALYDVLYKNKTVVIDEIESSIHPLLIKEIISKISNAQNGNTGQLIFTTHESGLLDQEILRRDEIWFAQKRIETGSSILYSLSDYNVHHTANIENGYLNGRYGGIPFLSNLHDLHWNNEQ